MTEEPEGRDTRPEDKAPSGEEAPDGKTGAATHLQPGGTKPGSSPGASVGSVGTGGGSTAGQATGNAADGQSNP